MATIGDRPLPFSTCFNPQSEWTSRQQRGKNKSSMEKLLRSPIVLRVLESVETYHCCCLQSDPWLNKWRWLALDTGSKHIIRYYDGTRKSHARINSLQKGKGWWCNRCSMCFQGPFLFLLLHSSFLSWSFWLVYIRPSLRPLRLTFPLVTSSSSSAVSNGHLSGSEGH